MSGFLNMSKQNLCKCQRNDECCMLLCRVTLGDALVEGVFRGNKVRTILHYIAFSTYILFFFFSFKKKYRADNIGMVVVKNQKNQMEFIIALWENRKRILGQVLRSCFVNMLFMKAVKYTLNIKSFTRESSKKISFKKRRRLFDPFLSKKKKRGGN